MKASITQEFAYGCGIACFAFATSRTYAEAAEYLGAEQAASNRFWVKDFVNALNSDGLLCTSKHLKNYHDINFKEGTIVLLRRSMSYPVGHYLVKHNGLWMDPWINMTSNQDISQAKSGYRKELPGAPMYAIIPAQKF